MKVWLCWLIVPVLTGTVSADTSDGFVEEIAADFQAQWNEQKLINGWHKEQPTVAGLGFEVVLEDNPRLLQRGFLDVLNQHNGNREVYRVAGWMDLGQVRTGSSKGKPKLIEKNWCYRKYSTSLQEKHTQFYVSRLTPAVLFTSQSQEVEFFAGQKWIGSGVTRGTSKTTAVPEYIAYSAKGKVIVRRSEGEIRLNDMDESWMLFWYGEDSHFYRSTIPNIVWKMRPVKEYMKKGYFVSADLPVLIVFQHKPAKLKRTQDSLHFSFGSDGAGSTTLTPLSGFYHPPVKTTSRWKNALPEDIVSRCRVWAQRLKFFPLSCTESSSVSDNGSKVSIRQKFSYLHIPDKWGTTEEKVAPIPPVIALAKQYGFDVKVSGEPVSLAIPTHSGPYSAIAGTDTIEFAVSGLDRYINNKVSPEIPDGKEAEVLAQELRDEVRKMLAAGRLAPAMDLSMKSIYRVRFHFANPAETLLALAEAMPYLDKAARNAAVEYGLMLIKETDPLKTKAVSNYDGARREYFKLLDADSIAGYIGSGAERVRNSYVLDETRANNAYALWAFADASGRWDFVKQRWDDIKTVSLDTCKAFEWATCGYFHGAGETRHYPGAIPVEDRGSVAAVNGQFARWIALVRTADKLGDKQTGTKARYLLARAALLGFAQGKLIGYMYDRRFQTIDAQPDWMFRLTTASGNGGGQGLLWTNHWAGADDDIRRVIRWDEFGPVISQMFGDHWYPIFPAFLDLTPECGRFLSDHLKPECRRFVEAVTKNAPAWFVTRRISNVGKEKSMDSPLNSYSVFLGHCYALGTDGGQMLRYQDIPFTRVGDLYHIRRLAANLRCFGGLKWENVESGK